jgi:hypothetical protein
VEVSSYSVAVRGKCGSQNPDCFTGGFAIVKNDFVVDGGFACTIDCTNLVTALGSSVYRALA